MVVLAKIPVRMTVDEFLKWDSEDGARYELVDGEPRALAPADVRGVAVCFDQRTEHV
jgi:hypothetical protein